MFRLPRRRPHRDTTSCKTAVVIAAIVCCAWSLPTCAAPVATPDASSLPAPTAGPSDSDYIASDASVTQLFDALASALGKPVVASMPARRKRVSGRFDLSHPQRVLDRVCADLGLISYFDGNVLYVYEMSELTNAMGTLSWINVGALRAFLRDSGIASAAFPIRGESSSQTFYVAGPPVYVDAVQAAARYLDRAKISRRSEDEGVKVIELKHTFVRDRAFRLRDQTVNLPGIASVLADLLDQSVDGGVRSGGAMEAIDQGDAVQRGRGETDVARSTDGRANGGVVEKPVTQASGASMLASMFPAQLPSPSPLPVPSAGFDGLAARSRVPPRAIRLAQRPVVLAYPDTNSLLIQGSHDEIDYVSKLVAQLDVEKTQIELSLWIIDINQSTLEQLGVRWQGAFNGGPVGATFNAGKDMLAVTRSPVAGFSTLDGARFLASVFALNQKGEAQIVSRPLILTQENVPAIFDSNQTFYVKLVGERTTDLESVTYGTMVSVIPRLGVDHSDIEMILDIEDGNTLAPDSDVETVDKLPVVNRTHLNTVARVPREMSLLIGGYTRHSADNDVTRIPLLSSIPLLGGLFRYRNTTSIDQVRVFLIQPRVLASREFWRGGLLGDSVEIAPGLSARDAADELRGALTAPASERAASVSPADVRQNLPVSSDPSPSVPETTR
ncbi:MAG TPA: type III secretion system outer membrane ring subunit SctC [Pararobbsia sp.]|nr:type III secretion system outer membrane ring subunit SctC [Pararobbsia sp.]